MQVTEALSQSNIRFDEPVQSILRGKPAKVWSIAPEASVYDAVEMMSDHQIGALTVTSGGILLGIISERDYARKVILRGRSSRQTMVQDIMTAPVLSVRPDTTIEECMRMITHRRVRHLPVLDERGELAAMISIGDIVNWIISSQGHTIKQLSNYITGKYPA